MDRFSLVLKRRPSGKPAYMSWTQPGLIAYMGLNEDGIGVCMNALNGPSRADGVPWYFIVRAIFEASSLDGAADAARRARRAISANAAMITPEGAADIEVTPDDVRVLHADQNGRLVHTNHCVHPDLTRHNDKYAARIFGQSVPRKARAEEMMEGGGRRVSVDDVKAILSDHEGYPTAICRHPNDDPATGWQRSVISMIVEPSEGRMHVSRGNPCEAPYEVYEL
jgi:isopenicillin-N N-acyltransferase-like protein